MRYRVDLRYGYISFDDKDEDKARQLYADEGLRLRRCRNLGDDGVVIEELVPIGTKIAEA